MEMWPQLLFKHPVSAGLELRGIHGGSREVFKSTVRSVLSEAAFLPLASQSTYGCRNSHTFGVRRLPCENATNIAIPEPRKSRSFLPQQEQSFRKAEAHPLAVDERSVKRDSLCL